MMPLHISRGHHSKTPQNTFFFHLIFFSLFSPLDLFSLIEPPPSRFPSWTGNWVLKNYYKRINGAKGKRKGGLRIKYRNIIKVKQLIYEKKKRYALRLVAKAPNVAQFWMPRPQAPNYGLSRSVWSTGWSTGSLVCWFVGWLGGWVAEWLSSWVAEWLSGWLPGWLAGWGINAFWYESVL